MHKPARSAIHTQGYKHCILTPNVAELGRIAKSVGVQMEGKMGYGWQEAAPQVCLICSLQTYLQAASLSRLRGMHLFLFLNCFVCVPVCKTTQVAAAFEGPIVVSKGQTDIVTDGCTSLSCNVPSGLKRSGGQGDILAGKLDLVFGMTHFPLYF